MVAFAQGRSEAPAPSPCNSPLAATCPLRPPPTNACREPSDRRKMTAAWWSMRLYIVPAVCYFLHNNLMFMVLGDVTPWTYMVLANLKIATTAVMFRFLLGRGLVFPSNPP